MKAEFSALDRLGHVLALVAMATACGASEQQIRTPTAVAEEDVATPPEEVPAVSLDVFAGTYAVTGDLAPGDDGCGGNLTFVARHVSIDSEAGTLFADVVDRTYQARAENDELVAEGRFGPEQATGSCAEGTIFSRWRLAREADGRLSGTLESLWPLPPECEQPCRVLFRVVATPSDQGQ